jgi:hypothetical protein
MQLDTQAPTYFVAPVRCQSIWVQGRLKLRDDLVHLVNVIMRRFCCVASAVLQRSFV